MAGRRLKVFQAQFGFFETVVAASSQAAALRAWGTRQNLFASGEAKVITDDAAVEAATAQPEMVLKRPVGSRDAFVADPTSLPEVPDAPPKAPTARKQTKPPPEPKRPPANRSALTAAEEALHKVDEDRKAEEASLRQRRAALEAEIEAAQDAYVQLRKTASTQVVEAREVYRKAGGRD